MVWSLVGSYDTAEQMLDEALAFARDAGDKRLLAFVLFMIEICYFGSCRFTLAEEYTEQSVELLRNEPDLTWNLVDALGYGSVAIAQRGLVEKGRRYAEESMALADRLGHARAHLTAGRTLGWTEFYRTADFDAFERYNRGELEFQQSRGIPFTSDSTTLLGLIAFWRGRWDEAAPLLEEGARTEVPGALGGNSGVLWMCLAYMGRGAEAVELAEQKRAQFATADKPSMRTAWVYALGALEAFAVAGERAKAAALYPVAVKWMEIGCVARLYDFRLLDTLAGLAATCGGSWDTAEAHYEKSLKLADELPMRVEQPEARRFYAQMLLERGAPGDQERARELLGEAIAGYRDIGMPRHIELAEALVTA
jgi:tetratricopeptide (TPR) repeat protein